MADFFDQTNTEDQNTNGEYYQNYYQQTPQDDFQYFTAPGTNEQYFEEDHTYYTYQGASADDFAFHQSVQPVASHSPYNAFDQVEQFSRTDNENQEALERKQRLQKIESEWTQRIIEKQEEERTLKTKRREDAKTYLEQWKQDRERAIASQKKINIQENETNHGGNKKNQYKNPWELISDNISLKASDYPGKKDITRMKESILNKKGDLSKQ